MSRRVYVPSTPRLLRRLLESAEIGPAPFLAHAVTDGLRGAMPDGGEEDWEYAAASAAALASVALLDGDEPARRVVVALDVPEARDRGGEDPTTVEVVEPAPLRRVASVLADAPEAEADVAAAREAVAQESQDVERLLDACLDHELGWWATQEIGDWLAADG